LKGTTTVTPTDRHLRAVPTRPTFGAPLFPRWRRPTISSTGENVVPGLVFGVTMSLVALGIGRAQVIPMLWTAAMLAWLLQASIARLKTASAPGHTWTPLDVAALVYAHAFTAIVLAGIFLTLTGNAVADGTWLPDWLRGTR
jgi:hypothetical protein